MTACLGGSPGNASSIHGFGQTARRLIDQARDRVAALIGARPEEIIFTSGGTEANNLAIMGAMDGGQHQQPHLVTSAIEHPSVLNPCRHVERLGGSVTFLQVGPEGLVDPLNALASLREETALVSLMLANNDVGTVQPVGVLSERTHHQGVPLHTDAVQAIGKLPVDVRRLGVDLLSFSSHKLHGPQGIGALYVREGTRMGSIMFGGSQERGLRPGTENIAAIAGFGKACLLASERLGKDAFRLNTLRTAFETAVLERVPGVRINGLEAPRLPNTSNLSFEQINGEALAIHLDLLGLAVSTGAACSTTDQDPSHVLIAMGRTPAQARSAIRISFGRENTRADVYRAAELIAQAVKMMRGGSP